MSSSKPSETAMIMASLRALSNSEKDTNIRCSDTIAACFLPEEKRSVLMNEAEHAKIKSMIPKGLYEYVISRTKYIDQIFTDALKNGTEQVVFLGAGYDSRPYRFESLLGNTMIFEVDTIATQEYKTSLLHQNGIEINPNIQYVAVDFEEDDLFKMLRENGYDESKKTLFIWEGVTFYLSENTVVDMLRKIHQHGNTGSRVFFDFQTVGRKDALIDTGIREEEIKFGIEAEKIESFVTDRGYSIVEHVNSSEMEKRFLILENGTIYGSVAPIMNFLLIERN